MNSFTFCGKRIFSPSITTLRSGTPELEERTVAVRHALDAGSDTSRDTAPSKYAIFLARRIGQLRLRVRDDESARRPGRHRPPSPSSGCGRTGRRRRPDHREATWTAIRAYGTGRSHLGHGPASTIGRCRCGRRRAGQPESKADRRVWRPLSVPRRTPGPACRARIEFVEPDETGSWKVDRPARIHRARTFLLAARHRDQRALPEQLPDQSRARRSPSPAERRSRPPAGFGSRHDEAGEVRAPDRATPEYGDEQDEREARDVCPNTARHGRLLNRDESEASARCSPADVLPAAASSEMPGARRPNTRQRVPGE